MQSNREHNISYHLSQEIAQVQLQPVPRPIGIFEPLIAQRTETLVLKEKLLSLSGDSFDIKLADGRPLLRVDGKVMSVSGRKKVYDVASGRYLFDIYKELFHLHTTYVVEDEERKARIMEVRNNIKFFGSRATATFTSKSGHAESLVMSGNWLDTTADIVDESAGNALVGRIDRKLFNAREIFGGQQTYALVVAPGVDMALLAALCICLDEKRNDN